MPLRNGELDEVRAFVNVTDADWPLMLGLLIAHIFARGWLPVTVFHGEQGSAKSTTTHVLRAIVDPNIAPLRTAPRNERDLVISGSNSLMLVLDNMSQLPEWL